MAKAATEAPTETPTPEEPAGLNLEQFAVDEDKEVSGVWFPIANDVDFLVARMNNTEYLRSMARLYKENRVAIERSLMEDAEADEKMCRILATTIFKGFRGPLKHKGKLLKNTIETRIQVLSEYKEVRRLVVDKANEVEAYRAEEVAEAGKPS